MTAGRPSSTVLFCAAPATSCARAERGCAVTKSQQTRCKEAEPAESAGQQTPCIAPFSATHTISCPRTSHTCKTALGLSVSCERGKAELA